jgi:hypothetical protein
MQPRWPRRSASQAWKEDPMGLGSMVAALLAAALPCATGTANAQVARIVNYSDWNIEYLFLSYTGNWD